VVENFPNLEKRRDIQIQEAYRIPNQWGQRRINLRCYKKNTQFSGQIKNTESCKRK
jgi:hypothetical protein